jgi:hypothetical protein
VAPVEFATEEETMMDEDRAKLVQAGEAVREAHASVKHWQKMLNESMETVATVRASLHRSRARLNEAMIELRLHALGEATEPGDTP